MGGRSILRSDAHRAAIDVQGRSAWIPFLMWNAWSGLQAQPSISGVINAYQPVMRITPNGWNADVEVSSAAGFVIGDPVLVIQMKGDVSRAVAQKVGNVAGVGYAKIAAHGMMCSCMALPIRSSSPKRG